MEFKLFIMELTEIKKLTNDHFQFCPGGEHTIKSIPDDWQPFYDSIDSIDDDIYRDLMSSPTEEEWYDIINQLPKNKAAGPSQITNEML